MRYLRRLPWTKTGWLAPAFALGLIGSPLAGAESHSSPANAYASLVVTNEQGEPLFQMAMPDGARWCLQWHHSVEKFAVLDCYRNDAGVMELERSHQPDFAAGLGHIYGRGEQVSDGQGAIGSRASTKPYPATSTCCVSARPPWTIAWFGSAKGRRIASA